jgi:hypothetical protein
MKRLFAVIRSYGGAWQASQPIAGQVAWDSHASFMNALEKKGFIVLGGPLEGTSEVLLVVRAERPTKSSSSSRPILDRPWPPWHKPSGALESPTRLTITSMTMASRAILKVGRETLVQGLIGG